MTGKCGRKLKSDGEEWERWREQIGLRGRSKREEGGREGRKERQGEKERGNAVEFKGVCLRRQNKKR